MGLLSFKKTFSRNGKSNANNGTEKNKDNKALDKKGNDSNSTKSGGAKKKQGRSLSLPEHSASASNTAKNGNPTELGKNPAVDRNPLPPDVPINVSVDNSSKRFRSMTMTQSNGNQLSTYSLSPYLFDEDEFNSYDINREIEDIKEGNEYVTTDEDNEGDDVDEEHPFFANNKLPTSISPVQKNAVLEVPVPKKSNPKTKSTTGGTSTNLKTKTTTGSSAPTPVAAPTELTRVISSVDTNKNETPSDLLTHSSSSHTTATTVEDLPVGDPSFATADVTRELVKRYISIWNHCGQLDLIPQVCAPNIRFNGSQNALDRTGHDGLRRMVQTIHATLSDYHCEIHSMVVEGNKAFVRLKFVGRHTSNLMGYPPTGQVISWSGTTEFTCTNGKILKVWELGDLKSLEDQLQLQCMQCALQDEQHRDDYGRAY